MNLFNIFELAFASLSRWGENIICDQQNNRAKNCSINSGVCLLLIFPSPRGAKLNETDMYSMLWSLGVWTSHVEKGRLSSLRLQLETHPFPGLETEWWQNLHYSNTTWLLRLLQIRHFKLPFHTSTDVLLANREKNYLVVKGTGLILEDREPWGFDLPFQHLQSWC